MSKIGCFKYSYIRALNFLCHIINTKTVWGRNDNNAHFYIEENWDLEKLK